MERETPQTVHRIRSEYCSARSVGSTGQEACLPPARQQSVSVEIHMYVFSQVFSNVSRIPRRSWANKLINWNIDFLICFCNKTEPFWRWLVIKSKLTLLQLHLRSEVYLGEKLKLSGHEVTLENQFISKWSLGFL